MLKTEFEDRYGKAVTTEEYSFIERTYMAAEGVDKDRFCKEWKKYHLSESHIVAELTHAVEHEQVSRQQWQHTAEHGRAGARSQRASQARPRSRHRNQPPVGRGARRTESRGGETRPRTPEELPREGRCRDIRPRRDDSPEMRQRHFPQRRGQGVPRRPTQKKINRQPGGRGASPNLHNNTPDK